MEDIKVNLYAAKSHDHYNKVDAEYDLLVKKMSHHADEQPKNIELPADYSFEYEYRPVVPLTLKDVTVASQVFQSKTRLALFLERVVVKGSGVDGARWAGSGCGWRVHSCREGAQDDSRRCR